MQMQMQGICLAKLVLLMTKQLSHIQVSKVMVSNRLIPKNNP
jgi:hypothetical protein